MSRLLHGLKTKQTRFALALKIALLGGAVAFSSVAIADDILKEGITPASDASQIPAAAKLRKDTVVAGIAEPQGIFNPYFFVNGWDENVTNVIFSRLIDWDSHGNLVPGLAESWTVSADNKVYTIKLRPNLTFAADRRGCRLYPHRAAGPEIRRRYRYYTRQYRRRRGLQGRESR